MLQAKGNMDPPRGGAKPITSGNQTAIKTKGIPNTAPLGDSATATASVATPATDDNLVPDSPGSSTEQDRLMPVRRDNEEEASQSKDREDSVTPESVTKGEPDVSTTEGRFRGMRSRMKRAGQGLKMKPPSPTTSLQDTAGGGKAGGGWSGMRSQVDREKSAAASVAKDGNVADDDVASDGETIEDDAMGGETNHGREDGGNSDAARCCTRHSH